MAVKARGYLGPLRERPFSPPLAGPVDLIGGVWADRLPRRTVMLTSNVVRAGTQSVTAALLSIVFMPLGTGRTGWLSAVIGVDSTLAAAAAICVVANLSVLLVPDVRNFRAVEATPEPELVSGSADESRDRALPAQLP